MFADEIDRSSPEPAALPRGVRRACEAMRAEPGRDLTVAELAALAGTAPRTLQRQFREFLGKSPLEVLRDIRFEAARRELLRGARNAKVADIAARCGLTHFGRFSVEYRRRYGESPSTTAQRQSLLHSARPPTPPIFARDRPMIAVPPIEMRGPDHGIGRDVADTLAGALTRSGVAVTSDVRSARYRLLGILRGDGEQIRLSYRLVDAETGRHIWAHRADGATADPFLFEERVAVQVAAAIQPGLRAAEIARSRAKADRDLTAYDLTLRAMPHVLALDSQSAERALSLLESALAADPDDALANALSAWSHAQRVIYQFTESPEDEIRRALALARRATTLGGDATVLAVVGNALTAAHQLDDAEFVIRKALALDGGSAWAWGRSGWIDVYAGRPEAAVERFAASLDLAPHDPLSFNNAVGMGVAFFGAGRYREAAHWLERGIAEHPSAAWAHRVLCPAYVLDGRKLEAERSLATMRRQYPGLTVAQVIAAIPFPEATSSRVANGLESLGVAAG